MERSERPPGKCAGVRRALICQEEVLMYQRRRGRGRASGREPALAWLGHCSGRLRGLIYSLPSPFTECLLTGLLWRLLSMGEGFLTGAGVTLKRLHWKVFTQHRRWCCFGQLGRTCTQMAWRRSG